ncbi:hypothetical protein [Edwardsiella tarda]|uniref:hypothetical protein n=1 Tax=Edwardsiella tarda TaxID=636 RepID=UPI003F65D8C1
MNVAAVDAGEASSLRVGVRGVCERLSREGGKRVDRAARVVESPLALPEVCPARGQCVPQGAGS